MNSSVIGETQIHPPERISLRDIATPLFRHKRLFSGTFLIVFIGVLSFGAFSGRQYQSEMEILVNRDRTDPQVSTQSTDHLSSPKSPVTEEEINSEAELLRSRELLKGVVAANQLQEIHATGISRWLPETGGGARVDKAVEALAQALHIRPIPKSNLIAISYSSRDPQRSYGVLHALGELYVEKHVTLSRPPGAYAFFAAEAERYKAAMDRAEQQLRKFAEDNQTADPELLRSGMAGQVTEAVGRLHIAEQAAASDESRIRSGVRRLEGTPERVLTTEANSPPNLLLQEVGGALLKAQTKHAHLEATYNSDYPLVQEAQGEIDLANAAMSKAHDDKYTSTTTDINPIHEQLAQDVERTRSELAGNTATIVSIQSAIKSMKTQMVSLDGLAIEQKGLMRQAKASEENYLLYLSKREQERAADALDRSRIANVAIAVPPSVPALPLSRSPPLLPLALALSCLASLIVTFMKAYFDPTFHTPAEVDEVLRVPFVVALRRTAA